MTMTEALYDLGVRPDTLSAQEKARLDKDGYLSLGNILSKEQVESMRQRFDDLVNAEGDKAGLEVHQEAGTDRLSDLVNKDALFDICFTHPRVLAAMSYVLKDFKLSSLNGRASLPAQGLQALHADWGSGVAPGDYFVCNSIWLLCDFTKENGGTRVIPGSHLSGKRPQDVLADPMATHPDEIQLVAPAGTVVIFNSHLWHGGTLNKSNQPRPALHSYFCRRNQIQQLNQRKYLRPGTRTRLSQAAQFILDV